MLVENYLWAVVSLPGGVFNPYSGVKTSILFFDRNLAKWTDEILFVKVENDGFDLGAQRRPIEGSQLPEALKILDGHKQLQETHEGKMALTVPRTRLLESPDINLSGDRYRVASARPIGKWPMVKLGDVCEVNPKENRLGDLSPDMTVSFVSMADVNAAEASIRPVQTRALAEVIKGYTVFRPKDVLLAKITPCFENGKVGIVKAVVGGLGFGSTEFIVVRPDPSRLLSPLLLLYLSRAEFRDGGIKNMTGSAGQQRVPPDFVRSYEIPLPPLDEQERIVAELEGYRKVIEGARQILASYKPTIRIDPKWPQVRLEEVAEMKRGPFGGSLKKEIFVRKGYKVYEQKHAIQRNVNIGEYFIDNDKYKEMEAFVIAPGDIIISCSGTMGRVYLLPSESPPGVINQALLKLRPLRECVSGAYLEAVLMFDSIQGRYFRDTSGAAIQNVSSMSEMRGIPVPLPPLDVQRRIVAELEAERKLVEANRELIARMEGKIQAKLAEVWGDETTERATSALKTGGHHG